MIDWILTATTIVPAAYVPLAQGLSEAFAGEAGAGMWTTGLSADGAEPATHFISSGPMDAQFFALLGDAEGTVAAAHAAGIELDLATITDLYAATVIGDGAREVIGEDGAPATVAEGPHALIERLGLRMVQPQEVA